MRVAAIDCGTNSIRLLVADVAPGAGGLTELDRRLEVVRLGQDVDRTGRFAPEALERTFAACERYARIAGELGAQRTRFVATSATRDARNRDVFVDGVRERLGVTPEVITGMEEARLSFAGATRELSGPGSDGVPVPCLAVDIGGGSTEFVLGADAPESACSVDLGCVRTTERHLGADPPEPAQVETARAEIDASLEEVARTVPLERARTLVGLAGTVTTVAAMVLDLPEYRPERIHHARILADSVRGATARLLAMPREQRAALGFMHPGRVDVIGGGALILERIVSRLEPHLASAEVLVSEHDILDGIVFSVAG